MGTDYRKECRGGEDCGDERHLCKIAKNSAPDAVREIIKNARYFCSKCGRSAHNADNLCKPLEI